MSDESGRQLRVLAGEPYYGGSHKAFMDGWIARSRHEWTLLTLPAHKWKWRMRHSAVTFADQITELTSHADQWDVLVCSDMLNLAELRGLSSVAARLPAVAYFHENQLTYPVRQDDPRDLHFAYTNMTTALSANAVWFNSAFHRDDFLNALRELLARMPDYPHLDAVDRIADKSIVRSPGIAPAAARSERPGGPMHILWAGRWEHDKNPEDFFAAVRTLAGSGVNFRLGVIGEQFKDSPEVFGQARLEFAGAIDHWGYQPTREKYEAVLQWADVIVSTANHEFFGLGVVEAVAAGAYPLLPDRLAYPELLDLLNRPQMREYFYDGSAADLASKLIALAQTIDRGGDIWAGEPNRARQAVERFFWPAVATKLDDALEAING